MAKYKKIICLCAALCLVLCACSTSSEGNKFTSDFHVRSKYKNQEVFTEAEQKAGVEELRKYRAEFPDQEGDDYYLSQPYPILNADERKFDCFLFQNNRCVGILAYGKVGLSYASSFSFFSEGGELPELAEWLADGTEFVLITDGMRLWFVSEKLSFPWNLKALAGPEVTWAEEYAPYRQALSLTKLEWE